MAYASCELSTDQLRRICDPAALSTFASTEELPRLTEVIGQDRAVGAISFGIDMPTPGYHIYALGPAGTGKSATIRKFLDQRATERNTPDDFCYVFNFADPGKPSLLRLPPGKGRQLQREIEELVDELQTEVPRAFAGPEYEQEKERIEDEFRRRQQALVQAVEEEAESRGLRLIQTPRGTLILPVIGGEAIGPEQYDQLGAQARAEIEKRQEEIQIHLRETLRQVRQLYQEAKEQIRTLDRRVVGNVVNHHFEALGEEYAVFDGVVGFLEEMQTHILEHAQTLRNPPETEVLPAHVGGQQPWFDRYRVNLLVDNQETRGAPVVFESNPTYHNLVGRIQYQARLGALVTDFSQIRAGALHRANGGYLIIDVLELLTKPFAWSALKRALSNREIKIEPMAEEYALIATRSLEPEPVPLDIKVVLLGEPLLYYALYNLDEQFRELFKVKADFAVEMAWSPGTAIQYAHLIGTLCHEEDLRHFDPSGVARVVEEGARLVEHQQKLATRFGDIVDLLRQASYWAGRNGHELVCAEDVQKAIDQKIYRSNQLEERIRERIDEGTLLIDTEGTEVGQVNGIAVIPLGDHIFGSPTRITARTYVGSAGLINIDRESELGGRIHNKGTMILAGYLGGTYAREIPLALSASITFEQLYEEVEGDSAASAELYALLSSLSGIPIRQGLAVTGSVNQRGEIQAIGGVNAKIEGFFQVCKGKGLDGDQGVVIPQSNVKNLMLDREVVGAVAEGRFHLYAVSTVDEGIAVLTGREAGERLPDGSYPEGTVNRAVQDRLRQLAQRVKAFTAKEGELSPNGHGIGQVPG